MIAAVALGASYLFDLGGYPLMDPDEGRNAGIAQAMADSNAFVIPRHNTLPYVDKPVLYFAATAVSLEVFGSNEIGARFASLLFTVATLILVAWFGSILFDRHTGVVAALATGATPLTLAFSRTVIFDSALTLFVVATLGAFYLATEAERGSARHQTAALVAWVAMALGVLTKGPVALLFAAAISLPYAAYRGRARHLADGLGVLVFIAIVLPWTLAMARAAPEYIDYVLVTETAKRFATDELRRTGPWWYFLPILVAGAAPWSLVVIARATQSARSFVSTTSRDPRTVFLFLWIVVPLVFFSLSQSKRVQYVLPLMPALGLAAAWVLQSKTTTLVRWMTAVPLAAIGTILLFAGSIVPALVETNQAIRDAIPFVAYALGTTCILSSIATWWANERPLVRMWSLAAPTLVIPFIAPALMDAIGDNRSARTLAESIERGATPTTEIVGVHAYPLSLPFYLKRPIILSTDDARELTSNYIIKYADDWSRRSEVLQPGEWWIERLHSCERPTVFIVSVVDERRRRPLIDVLPLLSRNRKYEAYGPCLPGSLVRH